MLRGQCVRALRPCKAAGSSRREDWRGLTKIRSEEWEVAWSGGKQGAPPPTPQMESQVAESPGTGGRAAMEKQEASWGSLTARRGRMGVCGERGQGGWRGLFREGHEIV